MPYEGGMNVHQTLYRKYRPKTFDEVCGEDHITSVLKYEAANDRLSHAYLFCGPRGTGKTSCARILAKAANCEHPVNGNPCGKCPSCVSIDNGSASDVIEMDAASNTGVDYIRDLNEDAAYVPAMLKRKIYIIDEVHMLSQSAFNALLKTLEEPPEHIIFILATTELHKLLPTIISRCQRFDFRRIKTDSIISRLGYIAECEKIPLEDAAAAMLAKQSLGGMRDAISLLELCAAGDSAVTLDRVRDLLGLSDIETLYKTAYAVAKHDYAALFEMVRITDQSSLDLTQYLAGLSGFWRDMLVFNSIPESGRADYFDYTDPEMRLLADGAKRFSTEMLTYDLGVLDEASKEASRSPQTKRLVTELALLRMSDPSLNTSNASLLARISALETELNELRYAAPAVENKPEVTTKTPASEPEKIPEPVSAAETVQYSPYQYIADIAARMGQPEKSYLEQCECLMSTDSSRVIIRTNSMGQVVLSSPATISKLRSMLSGAEIKIEAVQDFKKKQSSAIDELEGI